MEKEKQNILNPAADGLNVLVVYDDVCSGIEAKDVCDRLAKKLTPRFELKVSFWRLAALEFHDLAQMAADEAHQAHLLIVAIHGGGVLRASIKVWFSQWDRGTPNHGGRMVAQLRGILGTDHVLPPAYECVKQIAETAAVDFFSEVAASNRENLTGVIESIHRRGSLAAPLPDAQQWPCNQQIQGEL